MASLAPYFNVHFSDAPLGWLHTYAAGTLTPKATYQDQAGSVAQSLPTPGSPLTGIHLDANGRPPGGFFLGLGEYTFHLYTAAGTLVKTWDDTASETGNDYIANVLNYMTAAQIADVQAGTKLFNHATAVIAAIATGYPVYMPTGPSWVYNFAEQVPVPSNTKIYAHRARIFLASGVDNHVFRIANGADNVSIEGLSIDGNKAGNTGGNGISMGGTGGTNIRVKDCYVKDCSAHGIYAGGTTVSGIDVVENYVTGCVSGGITANDTVNKFAFNGNFAWLNGTHGVGILGVAKTGTINDNVTWDNGQGTPNADNLTGYNVANENFVVSGNVSIGGGNNGIHFGGSRYVMSNNTAYGATFYGVVARTNGGAGDDVVVSGNSAYNCGISGYWMEDCNGGTFNGNVSRNNVGHGFAFDNCTYVTFTGNTARGNGGDGFRNGTASSWLTFTGNTSHGNTGDGIELASVTNSALTGNIFSGNTGWGINVSGAEGTNNIGHNIVKNNTAGDIKQPATTTRVESNDTGDTRTRASAATLTLPPDGRYFYITGTTNITSITASFPERMVTLQFDAVLTVTDGSNLRLQGNLVTAFMQTLTLVCDGTNWNECARSPN